MEKTPEEIISSAPSYFLKYESRKGLNLDNTITVRGNTIAHMEESGKFLLLSARRVEGVMIINKDNFKDLVEYRSKKIYGSPESLYSVFILKWKPLSDFDINHLISLLELKERLDRMVNKAMKC